MEENVMYAIILRKTNGVVEYGVGFFGSDPFMRQSQDAY